MLCEVGTYLTIMGITLSLTIDILLNLAMKESLSLCSQATALGLSSVKNRFSNPTKLQIGQDR